MKRAICIPAIGLFLLFLFLSGPSLAIDVSKFCAGVGVTPSSGAPLDNSIQSCYVTGEDDVHTLNLANGITATIVPAGWLEKRMSTISGKCIISLGDGRYFNVIADINDPAILNKGDGEFHPFEEELVIEALKTITYPGLRLNVMIYLLPFPRANVIVSSASGNEVYLSPHVLEIPSAVTAYIVTHEIGHIFQFQNLPDSDTEKWATYKAIRRINDPSKFSPSSPHAYRPKEIFAEDFRVLFGGEEAKFDGTIENPELPSPFRVAGLEAFFMSLKPVPVEPEVITSLKNYPNPFNPCTEIHVELGEEFTLGRDRMTIRIYDITGALVRDLYSRTPGTRSVRVGWDGTANNGNRVASATYFARVQAGETYKTIKLLLVK